MRHLVHSGQIPYQRLDAVSESHIHRALQTVSLPHVPQQDSLLIFSYMNPKQTYYFGESYPQNGMKIYTCNEGLTNQYFKSAST
mmetsp:Transcript_40514/g.47416  ORF Transcript_40514/g.47416 Transcript_40514/m.47416 type:complete len:84 (+) Transcript_40514:608-859(+)